MDFGEGINDHGVVHTQVSYSHKSQYRFPHVHETTDILSSPLILLSLCHNIKQINTQHLSSLIFEQFECE
jgi:hypothetical protein